MHKFLFLIAWALLAASLSAQPSLTVLPNEQMRLNVGASTVVADGAEWDMTLVMANDNNVANGVLPANFRRWWGLEIGNLNTTTGETLNILVTNTEYSDRITPVWSLDGGATSSRIPGPAPTGPGNNQNFQIVTPPGIASIRLWKYFPFTPAMLDAWMAGFAADPRVVKTDIGNSPQARDIWMLEITDPGTASAGKKRVWIHAAVHASENTAYFMAQGLVGFLLGGTPEANAVLQNVIIDIVPMANPDGSAIGNYRVNANSVNLENEWGAPYDSDQPEIIAMQTQIEGFMGTASSPGANPITLLLNLHATHSITYPFHFVHRPNWPANGVTQSVRNLEDQWVDAIRARSPLIDLGGDQFSTLSGRPFVESMMHDRYSIQPEWEDVMAITLEGTYQAGPLPGVTNTPDDYRDSGEAIGLAIMDYYGIVPAPPAPVDYWMILGGT